MNLDWQAFFAPGTAVLALPNWQSPRVFVPANTCAQRWQGAAFLQAHRRRARVLRWALRFRAAGGLAPIRRAPNDCWQVEAFVKPLLPQFAWCAVSVGTHACNQKMTARLFDARGKVIGYLKYGSRPAAIRRLIHERQVLDRLPAGTGPRVLAFGEMGCGHAMLLDCVKGKPLPISDVSIAQLQSFFSGIEREPQFAAHEHPGLHFAHYQDSPVRHWLEDLSDRPWPLAFQHGDLTPWNVYAHAGSLCAIDWEYGSSLGFPYLDLAHWILITAALIEKATPAQAVENAIAALTAPWPGLRRGQARAVVGLSAYDAWRQAIVDGDRADEPMQRFQQAIWIDHTKSPSSKAAAIISPGRNAKPPAKAICTATRFGAQIAMGAAR